MAKTKRPTAGAPMLPLPGLIVCDLCHDDRPYPCTDSDARALGWRVWRGTSMTGAWVEVVLCPSCAAGAKA